jgi:hypothetical protein
VFLLAEATAVLAWLAVPADLPTPPRRLERTAGVVLLAVAVFLVAGQHLRPMLLAWTQPSALDDRFQGDAPMDVKPLIHDRLMW